MVVVMVVVVVVVVRVLLAMMYVRTVRSGNFYEPPTNFLCFASPTKQSTAVLPTRSIR